MARGALCSACTAVVRVGIGVNADVVARLLRKSASSRGSASSPHARLASIAADSRALCIRAGGRLLAFAYSCFAGLAWLTDVVTCKMARRLAGFSD